MFHSCTDIGLNFFIALPLAGSSAVVFAFWRQPLPLLNGTRRKLASRPSTAACSGRPKGGNAMAALRSIAVSEAR